MPELGSIHSWWELPLFGALIGWFILTMRGKR